MNERRRVAAIIVLLLIGGFAVTHRIALVNASAPSWPVSHHALGDRVDLEGAFCEYATEETDGYSLIIEDIEALSAREYAERYAVAGASVEETMQERTRFSQAGEEGPDEVTEIVVTMRVRNDGNENGHLHALSWRLVPSQRRNDFFQCDFDLWALANPAMESQTGFTIRPGTEMTLHVPFESYRVGHFPERDGGVYRHLVRNEPFELLLSRVPTRHVVDIGVPVRAR